VISGIVEPQRLSLLGSNTDWQAASIAHATAQHLMVRGLIAQSMQFLIGKSFSNQHSEKT
jgi:hypothetical protein